jgi:hypothetical protein
MLATRKKASAPYGIVGKVLLDIGKAGNRFAFDKRFAR